MKLNLDGKRVLVTGASKGIGFAIAKAFLEEGAFVCLASRTLQRNVILDSLPSNLHSRVILANCDFVCESSVKKLHDTLLGSLGGLDILVCNVGSGSGPRDPAPEWDVFYQSFLANFKSAYISVQYFLSELIRSNGNVLFIGSIAGIESIGAPTAYSVSKAALKSLCIEFARKLGRSVRFNMIAPGNIFHEGGTWDIKALENPEAVANMLDSKVPIARFGTVKEIADAALFLASPISGFANGSVLVLDGGQTISF